MPYLYYTLLVMTTKTTKETTMITKREWEQITKTDSYHVLRLENESYVGYQLQRLYYFLKHLIIKN